MTLRHGVAPTPGLRYKNLGKSGLRVSNVGLGTWPIFSPGVPEEQADAIVKLAYDSGINIFDISEAHSGMVTHLPHKLINRLPIIFVCVCLFVAIFRSGIG